MKKKSILTDMRLHIIILLVVIAAEAIGIIPFDLGIVKFKLLPMIYALIIGIIVARRLSKSSISERDMARAGEYVSISCLFLIAFMATAIGPNISTVIKAGPALILQEFGNLGTIFISIPVAVLVFKMDRTAIGSGFSISREEGLGIVANLYGLDSPEGRGVMGSYITGTLLGTIAFSIISSIFVNIPWFSPESLSMAAGTGSASMMSGAIAPIIEAFPEKEQALMGYGATSQVLSAVDTVYVAFFLGIPIAEWLYKICKGKEKYEAEKAALAPTRHIEKKDEKDANEAFGKTLSKYLGVLCITAVISIVGLYVSSIRMGSDSTMADVLVGMLWLFGITVIGLILDLLLQKVHINLPTILYIAFLASFASIPGISPVAAPFNEAMTHLDLLPLCTPILAYAGISSAKELDSFKKQGLKIVVITICALIGTYIGSAVIANIVLKLMGTV